VELADRDALDRSDFNLDLAGRLTSRRMPPIQVRSARTTGVRTAGRGQRVESRYGIAKLTIRRVARPCRRAARITGAALAAVVLAVAMAAVPARAAAPAVNAGAVWSQLMYRKLNLDAEAARYAALLPSLRVTATTRTSALAQAQQTRQAATTTLANAGIADRNARSSYATARAAAKAAKTAVTAAQRRRPRDNGQVIAARRALLIATTTVQARAATIKQTAAALRSARIAYATATSRVATATSAYQSATYAVGDTQLKLTSLPKVASALAAQASALTGQVVTQTRGNFTIVQTTRASGVTVNKIIAYSFQRMIDDAAKAGIQISGGGFRTKQQQIVLRTTNGCPDVWTAPASSCKVPTAIPGRSLHEIGLAIDLTSGRRTINDRNSAAFKWLAANAGRYGFVNLPSEPWHWSITGN
jgi:D-alanyl-D-alanine carboxypeptidase